MTPVCHSHSVRRTAVILCAVLAGLTLAASLYLESGRFQRFLQARVSTLIPGTLAWKEMDLSLVRGRAHWQAITLTAPSGKVLAQIPSLTADLAWTGLIAGELSFSSIRAEDPTLSIAITGQGESDLVAALVPQTAPNTQTPPFPLNLIIRDCQGYDLPVSGVTISGRFSGDRLSDLKITAEAPGILVKAGGGITNIFERPVLDIRADLAARTRTAARTLESVMGLVPGTVAGTADGPASLDLILKGTLDNPGADITATFGPGSFREQPSVSARLAARLENRVITLAPSQLDPGTGPILIDGTIDLRQMFPNGFTGNPAGPETISYALFIRQDSLALSGLTALPGGAAARQSLTGKISPKIQITGNGIVPGRITAKIDLGIEATGVTLPQLRAPADFSLHALAHLVGEGLDLAQLSVTGPGLSGTGQGRINLPGFDPESATLAGTLKFTVPDLTVPAGLVGLPAQGSADLVLRAHGPVSFPTLVADLEARDLSAYGVRADSLSARGGLDTEGLYIRHAVLRQKEGVVTAEGRMGLDPDQPMNFNLSFKNMALADLVHDRGIQGIVSGQISMDGTLEKPDITARITGDNTAVNQIPTGRVTTVLHLSHSILTIDQARILRGSSRADITGSIHLGDQTLDIRVAAHELNLADLAGLVPGESPGLASGTASLDLTARGTLASPELEANLQVKDARTESFPKIFGAFSATLNTRGPLDTPSGIKAATRISDFSLTRDGQTLVRIDSADAALEDGQIRLAPTPVRILTRGRMTLACTLDLDGSLTASALGTIPLAMAASLADGIRSADGDIEVSLTARGPVQSPQIQGTLAFSDLSLGLGALEQTVRKIEGSIRFTPDAVLIDKLTGHLGQGQFRITGNAGITGGKPDRFALALEARQVSLDVPDTLSLTLNSRLTLDGTPDASGLTGTVDLLDGRYYRDVDLNLITLATRTTRKVRPVVQDTRPEFLKTITLNIHVGRREPILVDNNLAYLTVSPDLTVRGTAHSPALAGRAGVDEGTIFFQKAKFEVTSGTVDFINPYKIEPEINITGETAIRSWTITVTVSSTPDNLQLTFSSDPSEPDADILSLIAFGKTTREMGTARGSGQMAAAGAAASMVAAPLTETLKEATGLDEVDISMAETDKGSTGVRVSLGADLSRQLSVAYGVEIRDGETVQQVTTYYKLLEHLLMSGFQDTGGRFGGGLKYRLEFR